MNQLEISFGTPLRIVVETAPSQIKITPWLTVIYEDDFRITAKGGDVMYTLQVDHQVKMQVSYVDAAGNPAKVDGVHWETSDESIATVEVDAQDYTIVTVTPAADLGQVQIRAMADADLGEGVRNLTTIADIEVVAGEAVSGTVTPIGEAEPIAPHVAPRKK